MMVGGPTQSEGIVSQFFGQQLLGAFEQKVIQSIKELLHLIWLN